MMTESLGFWRKCTTCKKPIGFGKKYWVCSVSTCNRIRTDLVFCDLKCFDAHVPVLNHRDAGAYERVAPLVATVISSSALAPRPSSQSLGVSSQSVPASLIPVGASLDGDEILVVVSKVKNYIRSQSNFNTSESVMRLLSKYVRRVADQAIQSAERHGRKTVLDRDIS